MSNYLVVDYSVVGYTNDGHDIHVYFVNGLVDLSRIIQEAVVKGSIIVEAEKSLPNECDVKYYTNNKGCLIVTRVST